MSDCDEFQCCEKEQFVHVTNLPTYHEQANRESLKGSEHPQWKYEPIKPRKVPAASSASSKPPVLPNISFESNDESDEQGEAQDDDENEHLSSLSQYYSGSECVYRRKVNFGTSWIGRKQYYASVFADPARIAKSEQAVLGMGDGRADKLFDSEFQSGNLLCAYKISENQYDLVLQNDINTKGNTQWFYFKLINPPKKQSIKLNIVNLRKSDSLFNYGMLPSVHSVEGKAGWQRKGQSVAYTRNDHQIECSKRYYYTLSFTVSTNYERDVLSIAHCYPYTYTDLNSYIAELEKVKYKTEWLERETIINTLGRNKVEVLTIKEQSARGKNRPLIIVLARQHPGETPASFVCQGLIDFLLSREKDSEYLRKNYEIKVIPMINPDGVVAGNYRSNLYGFDLNRRWQGTTKRNPHQSVLIKKYISTLTKGRETAFILDLHGHSRKLYSFFYGNPNPCCQSRVFPLLCSKLAPSCIRFEDSTFTVDDSKRSTARVQLNKAQNVFTYEVSFYGYMSKEREKKHFTMDGYRQLGMILGKGLYIQEKSKENAESKEGILYRKCLSELKSDIQLMRWGDKANSGSESQPEQCQMKEEEERKIEEEGKEKEPNPIRIKKRVIHKEIPNKSSRQMQVLDMARVNSIFPNDVIALIPSSFYTKHNRKVNMGMQTDNCPIIKVYQACKEQDNEAQKVNRKINEWIAESDAGCQSKIVESKTLHRPYSSSVEKECISVQLGQGTMKRTKEVRRRQSVCDWKVSSASQTGISFGVRLVKQPHFPQESNLRQNQLHNLSNVARGKPGEKRMSQSSYATIQAPVSKREAKQFVEQLKARKRSIC